MPLSDRTNVPSTPAHHSSPPCKENPAQPQPLGLKLPNLKNDSELAQRLVQDPALLTRIEHFYKNATPLSLLRVYLSFRCNYMDPSLYPATSQKRTITLGFPRRREYYGANLTSLPKGVPSIRFFKNGVPGPFLRELLEGPIVDDSDDMVVERSTEEKTYFRLDVSGAYIQPIYLLLTILHFLVALRGYAKTMVKNL